MHIYQNGIFITLDSKDSIFSTLIEHKGKIIYMGNEIPKQYNGLKTTDLNGYAIIPAFGDTHLHFISDSFFKSGLDLRGVRSYNELHTRISPLQNQKIIVGFGLSPHLLKEKKLPNKDELDKISTVPMFLVKYDGHAAIANTNFIKQIPTEVIQMKGYEEEKGHFYLDSFYKAADFASKKISPFTLIKGIMQNAKNLAKKGISFLHTAEGVGFPFDFDITLLNILSRFLPQDITIFFQTTNLKKIEKRKFIRIGGCFDTALDGCFGSLDAALKEPYSNDSSNSGNLYFTQERLDDFILKAHKKGLQISVHAIGDLAIEQAVIAFEKALQTHPRQNHRHIIIHACLLNDELIKRIAKLDIHLAVQTAFLDWPEEPMHYLNEILGNRANKILPLKSILDHNIVMGNGSDAPCTEPDPIRGIHLSCNHPDTNQSISILDALKMYSLWAARLSFDEKTRGSLEVGKCSDFVVLDQNPLEIQTELLKNLKIKEVYLKGKKIQ